MEIWFWHTVSTYSAVILVSKIFFRIPWYLPTKGQKHEFQNVVIANINRRYCPKILTNRSLLPSEYIAEQNQYSLEEDNPGKFGFTQQVMCSHLSWLSATWYRIGCRCLIRMIPSDKDSCTFKRKTLKKGWREGKNADILQSFIP